MPEEKESKAAKAKVCGHQNKQYLPVQGADPILVCTLPDGHQGDHQSPYKTLKDGVLVDAIAFWSDAAGTPVEQG
jgi:hypothetical protein